MSEKKKSSAKHELILAYASGLTPKQVMAKGYNEWTAYAYKRYFQQAQEIFREKFGGKA